MADGSVATHLLQQYKHRHNYARLLTSRMKHFENVDSKGTGHYFISPAELQALRTK